MRLIYVLCESSYLPFRKPLNKILITINIQNIYVPLCTSPLFLDDHLQPYFYITKIYVGRTSSVYIMLYI